jgi:chromosome partitioning protein
VSNAAPLAGSPPAHTTPSVPPGDPGTATPPPPDAERATTGPAPDPAAERATTGPAPDPDAEWATTGPAPDPGPAELVPPEAPPACASPDEPAVDAPPATSGLEPGSHRPVAVPALRSASEPDPAPTPSRAGTVSNAIATALDDTATLPDRYAAAAAAAAAGASPEPDRRAAPGVSGRPTHPGALHPLPRRFAVANQKGGVGKTTTAVNLGAGLAELGYRVLVVDLDPQGNATTGLGINARNLEGSIYDVLLHDVPLEDVVEPTSLRNLFVVPATIDLAGAEIELVPLFSRELRLRKALDSVDEDFDFVFIDCPPSLGLLTVNGLAAATEVVVPIQCEYYALEGLGQLLRNVNLVQSNLNETLDVSTIILTMYDARTRLAEQVVTEVRQHFGDRVCRNIVPRTVRLSEAPSYGQPIVVFDPSSRGAIAYRELAREVSGGATQRAR